MSGRPKSLSRVISDLTDLPHAPEVATIINVSTKYVATLALLSTLRYARIPTVVIDCESRDGSFDWFSSLMTDHEFYLVQAKLRQHGETLDWIFDRIAADRVLLVDSDVELLNDEMLSNMRAMVERSPLVYGAGYLHTARWLERHYCSDLVIAKGIGYYMQRPWIPFTLLRVAPIRAALSQGQSFMHRLALNDVPHFPLISRILWKRFRLEFFRKRRLPWLDPLRREYDRRKPCYVSYDTGAKMHEFLTEQLGLKFDSVSEGAVPWSVTHFSGITRSVLSEFPTEDVYKLKDANPIVKERLRDVYAIAVD